MQQTKNKSVGKIVKIALISLVGLFAFSIILGWMLGFKAYIVNGGSSEPMVAYRSLVIVQPVKAKNIDLGDVTSYMSSETNPNPITHRVVKVEDSEGTTIAEFREKVGGEIPTEWTTGEAVVIERDDLGVNVVAWYSGALFDETSVFRTQASNYKLNPLESTSTLESVSYSRMYGKVLFSIPNLGNIVLFIQKNIILVVATIACLFLLYNLIYNEMKVRK
jgi:hypothetical protein